ncbi:MAG TPA: MucB/RseB C-terminal domain-containing protein [Rhodocyclaceae bacterium]|nr:MucB/RseB C-terminal domain-containing protein [Rhodocyclaceae bacterium]
MNLQVARIAAIAVLQLASSAAVLAKDGDPGPILLKAVNATQRLNYSGVFVYRHGSVSESSRIAHFVDGGKEFEHLEVLDGSPREVIREGDEVKCYMPESRTVFIEKRSERRTFPAILPASLTSLSEFYDISKGTPARVAGLETQAIVLEPRDEYRYAHQFWIDNASGLLVKATLSDDRHEVLESFAFTELKIGGPNDYERMKVRLAPNEDWKVHHVSARESARADEGNWIFKNSLPGFRRSAGMRRQVRLNTPESLHFMFSDGLAAVSVFIEPLASPTTKADGNVVNMGAINAYRRIIGDYQILVMGEVPPAAVKRLGDGIELRRKQ